ncbi:hypothetical protein BC829DRAFT_433674 [Chytridium lagenaria]|nr:hypothetical protein BC829DRAFT_433674 [Chytridium lagenaria]
MLAFRQLRKRAGSNAPEILTHHHPSKCRKRRIDPQQEDLLVDGMAHHLSPTTKARRRFRDSAAMIQLRIGPVRKREGHSLYCEALHTFFLKNDSVRDMNHILPFALHSFYHDASRHAGKPLQRRDDALDRNSESMMATILDCNILNSMHKVGCLQAADALKRLGMCAGDLAKTRDKGIVAAIQYFANLTDGAPSDASKLSSQNATYSAGEVSGRPSEAEVLASDAPTVVPTHEVSIATSTSCTASQPSRLTESPREWLIGNRYEESESRCPEVGEMASHSIADRFNMNDRFASIDDDDDIVRLEYHDDYKQEVMETCVTTVRTLTSMLEERALWRPFEDSDEISLNLMEADVDVPNHKARRLRRCPGCDEEAMLWRKRARKRAKRSPKRDKEKNHTLATGD